MAYELSLDEMISDCMADIAIKLDMCPAISDDLETVIMELLEPTIEAHFRSLHQKYSALPTGTRSSAVR